MTYLDFILFFLFIPIVVIGLMYKLFLSDYKFPYAIIIILSVVALSYTIPWDNHLILSEIWYYDRSLISSLIFSIPVEECGFMVLQTTLSVIIFSAFLKAPYTAPIKSSLKGFLLSFFLLALGIYFSNFMSGKYLSLILLWSFLPVCLQWSFGIDIILNKLRNIFYPFIFITAYYCIIDGYAISQGIWTISEGTSLGINIVNLPIEEAVFFFFTNLFIAQAVILLKPIFSKNVI